MTTTCEPEVHVTVAEFTDFLAERLDAARQRDIVQHLLQGCSQCQSVARRFWSDGARRTAASAEERVAVERAVERAELSAVERYRALAEERAVAPELLAELTSHPLPRRTMLIANRKRFHSWALCELLLERGFACRFDDASAYEEFAETARLIAFHLDEASCGAALVHDMRARTLAHAANARRIRSSDLVAADQLLREAHAELRQGTGDPLELLTVIENERALRLRQNRFDDALALIVRQQALAERLDDPSLLGKALTDRGLVLIYLERFEEALSCFEQAERHLDPARDARILLAARHNRVSALQELGRLEQALDELDALKPMYYDLGDRLTLLRLRGLEGELALSLGRYELAEECFREARNGLMTRDVAWEAAQMSLYLAKVHLLTGKTRETKELAQQILPIFRSASLTTEAVAAILLFREAVLSETVTLQLVQQTLEFLEAERALAGH
jgi:tetratricopeptide (TPR) repeat protein